MKRGCDLQGRLMVSLLTKRGELARVHGKINGTKSLYQALYLSVGSVTSLKREVKT